MERLNQIIGRTAPDQVRRHPAPRAAQEIPAPMHTPMPSQAPTRSVPAPAGTPEHMLQQPPTGPLTRYPGRPLPEQMARLGQPNSYRTQKIPTPSSLQNAGVPTRNLRQMQNTEEGRYTAQAASVPNTSATPGLSARHLYPRSQASNAPSLPRRQFDEDEQAMTPPPTRPLLYQNNARPPMPRPHRMEDYPPGLHADVAPTWEAEDDEPGMGMRYDDWEGDEPIVYQRADVEVISNAYVSQSPTRSTAYMPESEFVEQKIRAVPAPTVRPTLPAAHETTRMQRVTQPLRPRNSAGAGQEQEQVVVPQFAPSTPVRPAQTPRPTQQLAPASTPRAIQAAQPAPTVTPTRGSTPRGVCPMCKGAGYLRANVPFGHPQFGKPLPCECKEQEKREKRRQQLLELSDIRAFRTRSFSNFNTRFSGIHPSVQEAFQATYAFAENPNGWLVLVGPNGCGKTHLAAAVANHCLSQGEVVLFSVVPELLDHLRAAFAPSSSEVYDQLFAKMREAGLLILDDLGAHYGTPWAAEKLFQLLNYRYNWRMPTIITSNLPGLQSLDIRLRSRMADSSLVVTINLERARDCRPYLVRQEP